MLLPEFCDDPTRAWGCDGFRPAWHKISDLDAQDFLRGLDAGLVTHLGRGQYRASRSITNEQFFRSGAKNTLPRRVTLWIEPIIYVAVLARLHFDFGWPSELIGTQSRKWEFDVTAYRKADADNEYIACEVKKTLGEIDQMVALMQRFARERSPAETVKRGKETNAYRKYAGLVARRPPVFWAVGPNGANRVFRMTYPDTAVIFEAVSTDVLSYPD